MSVSYSQFQQEVALQVLKFRYYSTAANPTPPAAVNAELNAIATALASDTTTHDETIENPVSTTLQFGNVANTDFTDLILYHVNKGKAGNLSTATMAQAIDGVTGALAAPGVVDVPYVSGLTPVGSTVSLARRATGLGRRAPMLTLGSGTGRRRSARTQTPIRRSRAIRRISSLASSARRMGRARRLRRPRTGFE